MSMTDPLSLAEVKRLASGNMATPTDGPPGGEGAPSAAQGDPEAAGAFLARAAASGRASGSSSRSSSSGAATRCATRTRT